MEVALFEAWWNSRAFMCICNRVIQSARATNSAYYVACIQRQAAGRHTEQLQKSYVFTFPLHNVVQSHTRRDCCHGTKRQIGHVAGLTTWAVLPRKVLFCLTRIVHSVSSHATALQNCPTLEQKVVLIRSAEKHEKPKPAIARGFSIPVSMLWTIMKNKRMSSPVLRRISQAGESVPEVQSIPKWKAHYRSG